MTAPVNAPPSAAPFIVGEVRVLFVRVSVLPIKESVQVASGKVMTLSPVGSTALILVSCAFAVVRSKTTAES